VSTIPVGFDASPERKIPMKTTKESIKNLSLMAVLLGAAASAPGSGVVTFTIQGYVNFGATVGPVVTSTFGIATGDSFTGTLAYDSSQPGYSVYGIGGPEITRYQMTGPVVSFTVKGQQFSLFSPFLYVYNVDGSGTSWEIATAVDAHSDPGFTVSSPWGGFSGDAGSPSMGQFSLTNSPGFSLPNSSLPTQLDIADWPGGISLAHDFGAVGGVGNGSFYLYADITSITVAPEPGTLAILGLGFIAVAMVRRRGKD